MPGAKSPDTGSALRRKPMRVLQDHETVGVVDELATSSGQLLVQLVEIKEP